MEMDLTSRIGPQVALDTSAITTVTTTVGNILDSKGFESLDLTLVSGLISSGIFTAIVVDGDDSNLADEAVVSASDLIGALPTFDNTESDSAKHVGYRGKKQFVQLKISSVDSGGTVGTFTGVGILGNSKSSPTQ